MKVPTTMVPSSRVKSYNVVNPEGDDLGQVQEFMLDLCNGRIAYAIVSFGGIMGITDKWFALPWDIMAWSEEKKKFVVDMPREVLEKSPSINKDKWPEEIDLSWLSHCYSHYGCSPYWE